MSDTGILISVEDAAADTGQAGIQDPPLGILISASAGSGKTYRLVHHYLGILYDALLAPNRDRQPLIVDRILTATFTRAAAAEIVERILRRLAEAMTDSQERRKLCVALGAGNLSEENCGTLLAALADRLHRLRVCTLDSFMVRSAQAFSAELGLPDSWSILDDPANQAACLEAVDEMLVEKAADPETASKMLDLLLRLSPGRYPLRIRERLVERLTAVQHALDAGPARAWEVIAPVAGDLLPDDELGRIADSLQNDAMLVPTTQKAQPNLSWIKALGILGKLVRDKDWEALASQTLFTALAMPTPTYSRRPLPSNLIALLSPLSKHTAAALISALRERNRSTRELLIDFVDRYHRVKLRRSAFRFDDFTRMLLEAGVAEHLADFYYRMDGQIDHVLLDEFQDTSIPQWKLLQPMVDELMSGEGGGGPRRSFFCVGDVKQTLYGWRNAEPKLLGELARRWPALNEQYLLLSQRSCPVIIETVNRVFGRMFGNAVMQQADADHQYLADAANDWEAWFREHDTARKNVAGFCRLCTCAAGESAAELQANAVSLAAERVAALHAADPGAQTAVLVRRRKFIAPVLARLRRLGIPASGEGGSPLADDMAVCTVLSLLHLLDHPSDTAAAFHVASSPLGAALGIPLPPQPADAPERKREFKSMLLSTTRELRGEVLDRGLGAAINRWMGLCAAGCDARNFRRLGQLVALAHGYQHEDAGFGRFIDTVRATNVEDSDASAVQVMTIHAAKGRQFDFVILPDLDRRFINTGPEALLSRPHLLDEADCITTRPSKAQVSVDVRLKALDAAWKRRQVVEELCTLYVAMTRAKTGMEMIVHPAGGDKYPSTAAGVLRGALAEGRPAEPESELWRHERSVNPGDPAHDRGGVAPAEKHSPEGNALSVRIAPAAAASRLRPVVAPSALEGAGYINLSGMLSFAQSRGLDYGTVIHRWFEMIDWLDEPAPPDAALRQAAAGLDLGITTHQLELMLGQFRMACASPAIRQLLSRSNYLAAAHAGATVEAWRERHLAVPMEVPGMSAGAIVNGQIDRVAVVRAAGGVAIAAEVIDYKTDSLDGPDAADAKVRFYAPQIRTYQSAVARLLGLKESAVTARLAFVGAEQVVEVHA